MSHPYEYFARDPRTGWYAVVETTSRDKKIYAPFTAHRVTLSAQRLWNIGLYDPPVWILGWRTFAGTTIADQESEVPGGIPAALRFFLGGDATMRGFQRKELPIAGDGYLSAFYQGLELRIADTLPRGLQPLLFIDGAVAGRRSAELEREIYWSPGFGVRWGSPVGALRLTAAYGLTARSDPEILRHAPHWQFFFSWGQEF
jgi:translocation and assembly module TamA